MNHTPRFPKAAAAALFASMVLLAACGSGRDAGAPAASSTSTSTSTPPGSAVTATVDWAARTVDLKGASGYEIRFCDGDAPILCVARDGELIGGIELVTFPGGAEALDDGADAWAADHYRTLTADRREGCDPAYELDPDEIEAVTFAGQQGYRYGFTGSIDGRPVERVIGIGAARGDDLHLLVLNALADDGCLAREGELDLTAAADLDRVLDALAAGSANLP